MAKLEAKITLSAIDRASDTLKKISKNFEKIKKASENVSSSFKTFSTNISPAVTKIRNVGLAATGVAASIVAMTKSASDSAWQIKTNAKILRMNTEQYQRWSYAVTQYTEVSQEGFQRMAMGLNKLIVQAAKDPASDVAAGFKKAGIQVRNSQGEIRSFQDVLVDIAEVSKNIANPAQRMAFLQAYLGRFGNKLAPILEHGKRKMGPEGWGIGIQDILDEAKTLSDEKIKQLEDAGNAIWWLQRQIGKFSKMIAIGAAPAITKLTESISEYIDANQEMIAKNAKDVFEGITSSAKGFVSVFKGLLTILKPVVTALGGLENVIKILAAGYILKIAIDIGKAARAMGLLNLALWANPYTIVIAGLMVGAVLIYKYWEPLVKLFEKVGKAFEENIAKPISKFVPKSLTPGLGETESSVVSEIAKGLMSGKLNFNTNNMVNLSKNDPQEIKVYMKIDAEGRPKDVRAKSNSPFKFEADTGVMFNY